MSKCADLTDEQIKVSFDKFDTDGSGCVTASEIKNVLSDMGLEACDCESIKNVSKIDFYVYKTYQNCTVNAL